MPVVVRKVGKYVFSSIWQLCPTGEVRPRRRLRFLRLEGAGEPGQDGGRGNRHDAGMTILK